jgi:hypothetical protein
MRISVEETPAGRTVTLRGRLAAADLKRLEHACGPQLERRQMKLEIVLHDGRVADAAVLAYLERLQSRGARVRSRSL